MIRKHKKPIVALIILLLAVVTYAVDTKLSDLTKLAQGNDDLLLYCVTDPNVTPLDRYIPWEELILPWDGSANITTLGTIATGIWQGTVVDHERGGLEVDVSGYSGLVAIAGGATAEVDALSELEAQIADVTIIYTEAVIPAAGTDPDVDASGELAIDTDGANEPNDVVLRTSSVSGNQQYALARVIKSFQCTIVKPNDFADATRDAFFFWENSSGMSFIITKIRAWSDTDDTTVNVETVDSDWDNNATVDALEIATDEVANFSTVETVITAATIVNGSLIIFDFDDTDDPGWVKFNIMGYFDANVD